MSRNRGSSILELTAPSHLDMWSRSSLGILSSAEISSQSPSKYSAYDFQLCTIERRRCHPPPTGASILADRSRHKQRHHRILVAGGPTLAHGRSVPQVSQELAGLASTPFVRLRRGGSCDRYLANVAISSPLMASSSPKTISRITCGREALDFVDFL